MTSDRILEIQKQTACSESTSVYQALLQVWNEVQQEADEHFRNSFAEVEAEVILENRIHIRLRYTYNNIAYGIELPRTSQNKHLRVGDKVRMALGIERQPEVPKKSQREIYETLWAEKYYDTTLTTDDGDKAIRIATQYAVENTAKEWRGQWVREIIM